jgi:5-hydroxyisourate hydrolase-like protein (transthyretin family)
MTFMPFAQRPVALLLAGLLAGVGCSTLLAQDSTHRGRKYKAPPATSHIEVDVLKNSTGKPVANAAVVFHAVKDGKDEGNLEVKTNDDGKAMIDVIATGSAVDVQVIADGLATYAQQFQVNDPAKTIEIRMMSPRAQISAYVDNSGKASQRPIGVQEPDAPSTPPDIQAPKPTNHTSDPDAQAPVGPNATPGNSQNQQTGPKPTGVPPQL